MQQKDKFLVIYISLRTLEIFHLIKEGDKNVIDFKIVFTIDSTNFSAELIREALKTVSLRTGDSYLDKNLFIDEKKDVVTVVAYGDFIKASLLGSTIFSLNSIKKAALDIGLTLSSAYTSKEVYEKTIKKNKNDDMLIVSGGFENTNSSHIINLSENFCNLYIFNEDKNLNPKVLYVGNSENVPLIKNIFSSRKAEVFFEENILPSFKELNFKGCIKGIKSIVSSLLLKKISEGKTLWKENAPFLSDVSVITSFIEGFFYEKKLKHLKVIKLDKDGAYISSFYKPKNEEVRKYSLFARYSDTIFNTNGKIEEDTISLMRRYFSSNASDEELTMTASRIVKSSFSAYTSADKAEAFSMLKVFITTVVNEHIKYVDSIRDTEQPRLPSTAFQVRGTRKSPTSKEIDTIILTGRHPLLANGSERQIILTLIDSFFPSGFTKILWDRESALSAVAPVMAKTKASNYSATGDAFLANMGYVFAPVTKKTGKDSIFNIRIRNDEYAQLFSLKKDEIEIYTSEKSFFMKPEWNNEVRLDPSLCGLVMDMRCREEN